MAMIQPWADEHGVEIQYSSTRDINAQLTTQIAGGNPPDIAGLPGPARWRSSLVTATSSRSMTSSTWTPTPSTTPAGSTPAPSTISYLVTFTKVAVKA